MPQRSTRSTLFPYTTLFRSRAAGYRYDISILQAEFSLTQMLDQPVSGRIFFEQVIRDNLDLGRPDRVQLIFNRRDRKSTRLNSSHVRISYAVFCLKKKRSYD